VNQLTVIITPLKADNLTATQTCVGCNSHQHSTRLGQRTQDRSDVIETVRKRFALRSPLHASDFDTLDRVLVIFPQATPNRFAEYSTQETLYAG